MFGSKNVSASKNNSQSRVARSPVRAVAQHLPHQRGGSGSTPPSTAVKRSGLSRWNCRMISSVRSPLSSSQTVMCQSPG
jgi:hypothetical protein